MVWIIGSNTHGGGRGSQAGLGAVSHSAGLAKSLPTQRELLLRRESLGKEPRTGQKWPGPGATASHHLCWAQQRRVRASGHRCSTSHSWTASPFRKGDLCGRSSLLVPTGAVPLHVAVPPGLAQPLFPGGRSHRGGRQTSLVGTSGLGAQLVLTPSLLRCPAFPARPASPHLCCHLCRSWGPTWGCDPHPHS